jgi:hypothetical protein
MAERTIVECDFCGQPMLHGCINIGNLQFFVTCKEFQIEKDICDSCLWLELQEWINNPEKEETDPLMKKYNKVYKYVECMGFSFDEMSLIFKGWNEVFLDYLLSRTRDDIESLLRIT